MTIPAIRRVIDLHVSLGEVMKTIGFYEWILDDVQFAIDVRHQRELREMSQGDLAKILGFASGSSISGIEVARPESITLSSFLALCNFLELRPSDYFDMQKVGEKHER